jgi:putative transposase
MKELRVLGERWRVHYNTVRPHSWLGYRAPAPAAWLTETSQGYGKVESKERFPLSHTPDCGGEQISTSPAALHQQSHWYKKSGRPLRPA